MYEAASQWTIDVVKTCHLRQLLMYWVSSLYSVLWRLTVHVAGDNLVWDNSEM
jgi:hypothetical protein